MPLRTLVALWNKGNSVLKRHLLYFISRTTPFQNPATARTADSRERTGAAKAPVCSPAILSIDRFALNSGGKRVPTAANDLRHTVPARVARLLWRAKDTTSAPFTPHSGPHGQTEECCLRSVLLPLRPRKVGPGFRPETASAAACGKPGALLAPPKGGSLSLILAEAAPGLSAL